MITMHSMDPISIQIGPEKGISQNACVMIGEQCGTVVERREGQYCLRQKLYTGSYSISFTLENLSHRTCEFTLDLSGSRNLLFSESQGKVTKMIGPGSSEFMLHAEAMPGAEEVARVAKVTCKELY
jgi:hypothetical protein